MSELGVAARERVATGMFAEHDAVGRQADGLGRHDLVTQRIAEHAMLVNAGFMRERVAPDDGLIGLHRKPENGGERLAGGRDVLGANAGGEREAVGADPQRHHDFLQRSVAGAFADAVDGALHLPGAGFNRGQAIGDGEPEIVVAVHGDGRLLDAAHALAKGRDQARELRRDGVADGVRNVERGGAGLDHTLQDRAEEFRVGAGGVLGGELDVVTQGTGIGHSVA